MRTIYLALGFVLFTVLLIGQAPSPAPVAQNVTPVKDAPPAIPDAHRAFYFKAQLQFSQAQQALQQAQQKLQEAVSGLTKDCGEKYRPQMDAQGDPVCVAEPVPPAAKEKK